MPLAAIHGRELIGQSEIDAASEGSITEIPVNRELQHDLTAVYDIIKNALFARINAALQVKPERIIP